MTFIGNFLGKPAVTWIGLRGEIDGFFAFSNFTLIVNLQMETMYFTPPRKNSTSSFDTLQIKVL